MTNPAEQGHNTGSEPQITVPLSVLSELFDHTTRMSEELGELRSALADLMLRQAVQPPQEAVSSPVSAPEPATETPALPVRIFTGVAAAAAGPTNHLEVITEQQGRERALRETLSQHLEPYKQAIISAARPKLAEARANGRYKPKDLPPMPAYMEDLKGWRDFTKKHGQVTKWSEAHGDQKHEFSLTYLPRGGVAELVGFESSSTVVRRNEYGQMDIHHPMFYFGIDQGELVQFVFKNTYYPQDVNALKRKKSTLMEQMELELTSPLRLVHGGKKQFEPKITFLDYVYDQDKQKFIHPTNHLATMPLEYWNGLLAEALEFMPTAPDMPSR